MSENAAAPVANAAPAPAAPAAPVEAPAAAPTPTVLPVAPADPAPAPAPQEPAPAPKEPAPVETDDGTGPVVYEATGDVGLDMALAFIGKQGLTPDHPAVAAAITGDFTFLKAELAGRGAAAQGWEQYVALAEKSYEAQTKANAERAAKDQEAIYSAVGGEANWQAIREWAGANATEEEKAEVNAVLQSGGRAARAMAVYLADLHRKATGTTVNPQSAVNGNAPSSAPSNGALSPRAYAEAVQELGKKLRGNIDGHPEYRQLQARRAAWRGGR